MKIEELEVYNPEHVPGNFKSLIGFETEHLKVISRAPNKGKLVAWNCLCKHCGEYCVKLSRNIKRDQSCGCQKNKNIGKALRKDLTGLRSGMLTALYYTGKSNSSGNAIWHCRCECGNECDVDSNNLTSQHTLSCGCINYSIGAEYIENILKQNKIHFTSEYPLKEVYDNINHPFRIDFAILDNTNQPIRFIEYDGVQHFVETWGAWKGGISLKQQQERDQRKNEYALSHNIPLVRIPYWERNNITLDLILGDKYLVR